MITHCPHCRKELRFSETQHTKIASALKTIQSGTLKLRCPLCNKSIELLSDGSLADWRQENVTAQPDTRASNLPEPPPPPDVEWLTAETFEDEARIQDIPKALILIDPGKVRDAVAGALVESFFQPINAGTVSEGLSLIRGAMYTMVVLHSGFDGVSLRDSEFHKYMCRMPMTKRRYLIYVLVGPGFHSLYSLDALSNSANLVINDNDVRFFKNFYKRARTEYDDLFGPYIEALKSHGIR
ncbi:MAG: zinc-ribbon domain-containing protein [Proteobacteria bacterium]|nr:zinc-ribbon domain-containing protein [Pseudomonadota bacterium]MBU1686973.1 zinc-ribbon domain-containing protein [Pseudomonadota bacterium]